MRRSLAPCTVILGVLSGCGPSEIFVTRTGDVTVRVTTADNRAGVPCVVTHTSFGEEDTEAPSATLSGQVVTCRVAFTTPLRLPMPFKPRVALVARCSGYEQAMSAEREVGIAWLTTPRTDVGMVVAQVQ